MFGNGTFTANRTNSVNTNTKLTTLYGDDSMVSIGAWNTNLSVKFHPTTGKNADGITQYAQDNTAITNVVITPDNARALLDGIYSIIIPAIENRESKSVAVRTGTGDNMKILCVATENGTPYLYVVKNAVNGIASEDNVVKHHFSTRSFVTDYSYVNGSGTEIPVNTGFKNFVKRLEGMDRLIPDVSHSISYSQAIRSAMANNYNQNNNAGPRYEAPVNTFEGSGTDEFLPFA